MNVKRNMRSELLFMQRISHSLRKNIIFSIMHINNLEYPNQSFIQILQNPLNQPLILVKGLVLYAQQDISLTDLKNTKNSINELAEFINAYTSNYLTYGTSETLKKTLLPKPH